MRRTRYHRLLALLVVAALAGCSGDGATPSDSLRFMPIPAPPRPIAPNRVVENADTILALAGDRLLRYDQWGDKTWVERGRDLPSAKSRPVSWNDRVWYLTTDRGRLELVSVALSDEQRTDTRVISGATDDSLAIFAARDAVYVFGADVGTRLDVDGKYSEFPGPPDRRVTDWSTAHLAELSDGAIVVVAGNRVRWFYEPDIMRWTEPQSDLGQREIRSMAASDDGTYLLGATSSEILRLVAANRVEPVSSSPHTDCDPAALFATSLGFVVVGCGKYTFPAGGGRRTNDLPAGASIVSGPQGRPLAIGSDGTEVHLLEVSL